MAPLKFSPLVTMVSVLVAIFCCVVVCAGAAEIPPTPASVEPSKIPSDVDKVAAPSCDAASNPCTTDPSTDLCKAYKERCEAATATGCEAGQSVSKPGKHGGKNRKPGEQRPNKPGKHHKHKVAVKKHRKPKHPKTESMRLRYVEEEEEEMRKRPHKPGKPGKPANRPQKPGKPSKPANKPEKPAGKPKPEKPGHGKPDDDILEPAKPSGKPQKPAVGNTGGDTDEDSEFMNEQPIPVRPSGCVGSAQSCNCDCCPGLYCIAGAIPGSGRTCLKQKVPPPECKKYPNSPGGVNGNQEIQQGAGSIPVVGSGLQQGATTATTGNTPNSGGNYQQNPIPGVG